jgi:hypothetical protein
MKVITKMRICRGAPFTKWGGPLGPFLISLPHVLSPLRVKEDRQRDSQHNRHGQRALGHNRRHGN